MYNKPKYNPNIHHRRSIRLKGFDYSQAGLYFITICCQDRFCYFGHVENDAMILNEYGQIAFDEWMKLPERFPNFELDVFQIMPNHIHAIISLTNPATVGATLAVAPNGNTVAPNGNAVAPIGNAVAPNGNTVAPIGNAVAPNGNTVAPNGNTVAHDGDVVAPIGDMVAPIGNAVAHDGDAVAPIGDMVAPNGNTVAHDTIGAGVNPAPTRVSDIVRAYKSLVANGCLKIFKSKNEIMGKLWQRNYYEHIIRNEQSYQRIATYIMNNPENWAEDKFHLTAPFTPQFTPLP